jgi:hypothetical protein
MNTSILFLLAAGVASADSATLTEQYTSWKYAAEVQVRNVSTFERLQEVVDVGLRLPANRTANLENDARVVLKEKFDELVREIPFQIYDIKTEGDYTTCRVAFYADLPPNGFRRFAVFYDNPKAARPIFERRIKIERPADKLSVETPFYSIVLEESTGQCVQLLSKIPKTQTIYAQPENGRPGSPFPLPAVSVPALQTEENRPQALRLAEVPGDRDEILEGPVFSAVKGQRNLLGASGDALASVKFTYIFYANVPHFVVETALTFLRDAAVYSVETNTLGADQGLWTHYLFRPVTPTFPLTEIEEVGSVMVDTTTRKGFPDGDLLAGMLPADLAWQSLGNIDNGFSVTGIHFFSQDSSPDSAVPYYRLSTRARLRQGWVEWSNAPIYVTAKDRLSNAVQVHKGTIFNEAQAVYFSDMKDGDWRAKTDDYGRRLNTKMDIKIYPKGTGIADDDNVFPHYGARNDAYLRGIR